MSDPGERTPEGEDPEPQRTDPVPGVIRRTIADRIREPVHRRITLGLQAFLVLGVVLAGLGGQWLSALTTAAVVLVTLLPVVLGRRFRVFIPPEFEVLAVVFVFASLFLGEVQGYYVRFWWWDVALHAASGFLLGILGFLLVYVLNEKEDVELDMKPVFVALFAFVFAVGMGALWEIFEFSMDSFVGLDMQKEMLGDPSGLTDTMWDLIVDAVGAVAISVLGYGYLTAAGSESFLERWIGRFVEENPHLFGDPS